MLWQDEEEARAHVAQAQVAMTEIRAESQSTKSKNWGGLATKFGRQMAAYLYRSKPQYRCPKCRQMSTHVIVLDRSDRRPFSQLCQHCYYGTLETKEG